MPLIRLISRDNGVGLSQDLALMAEALRRLRPQAQVQVLGFGSGAARVWLQGLRPRLQRPADLQIFLERVYPSCLAAGRRNVLVPNPEWFQPRWARWLPRFDAVWCKSHQAESVFAPFGRPCRYVGFTSQDPYEPQVPRQRRFFHLAGHSSAKNTDLVLQLWARHPEWPPLTVVRDARKAVAVDLPNVEQHTGYMPASLLRTLQNSHLFHLCPSRVEGFGHYLMEALGAGAIVLATDGAPMNELVTPQRGLLIPVEGQAADNLGVRYRVEAAALERTIERALTLDEARIGALSAAARAFFLEHDRQFRLRLEGALQAAGVMPGGAAIEAALGGQPGQCGP